MEIRCKTVRGAGDGRQGGILITAVMLLAFTVLLLGFGRLVSFRRQVEMRLDREREIQQQAATRSALRWLKTVGMNTEWLPVETNRLGFETTRGPIGVSICPAQRVFPVPGSGQFDSFSNSDEVRNATRFGKASGVGFSGDAKLAVNDKGKHVVELGNNDSEPVDVNAMWIDIDSGDVPNVLWTSDPYGRRYKVEFTDVRKAKAGKDGDILYFALTPKEETAPFLGNPGSEPHARHAIWMKQTSVWPEGAAQSQANVELYCRYNGVDERIATETMKEESSFKGIQLSGRFVSLFEQTRIRSDSDEAIRATHNFEVKTLDEKFMKTFSEACSTGLRMTVAARTRYEREFGTNEDGSRKALENSYDRLARLSVTPAYEYSTLLDWETSEDPVREISTVVRVDPYQRPDADEQTMVYSYDTHGTYATRKKQVRR